MKLLKKILLSCLAVLLVGVISYGIYYLFHYVLYDDYKDYLRKYSYEEGKEFVPLTDDNPSVEGMVLGSENKNLKLYVNPRTGEIALFDKRSGETVYSNPQSADQDTIANEVNKNLLKSQLNLEYLNNNQAISIFNSYEHSVLFDQITIEAIENGFRFIYKIGDGKSKTGIVPIYIKSERLESFLIKLEEKNAKYIRKRYKESKEYDGYLEIAFDINSAMATLNKIETYLIEAGYTEEDFNNDMSVAEGEVELPISFTIPLEYRLVEDGITATVKTSNIEEHGGGKLYRIQLLRYFAAGGINENGYLILPNGSGSLIYFNNGKINAADYSQFVYGIDPLLADIAVVENTEPARLPLFGIQREKFGVLATIESGDSLGHISASISGIRNSYNNVYFAFPVRGYDMISLDGSEMMPFIEPKIMKQDIVVRFTILNKEYDGYSGMANYYRERLISEGKLTKHTENTDLSFYMDVIGGVKRTNFILGSQVRQVYPMTTYEEANSIVKDLNQNGVKKIIMNYQGWFNGGYYHDTTDKFKLVKKLGSEKELEGLSKALEENGGKLYGDVAFQKVTWISKRYKSGIETVRYFGTGIPGIFGQVNPTTLIQLSDLGYSETVYNLVSPKFLPRYVEGFSDGIKDIAITGVSLRDLGDVLTADKRRTNIINREEAKQVVEAQFETLKNTGKQMMVNGGNSYSLPYASDIINAPLAHNDYFLVDEEIPFYQMIFHGCIDYSGNAINLMNIDDKSEVMLKLIEYGAGPHYTFTYQSSSELKYTGLNSKYSTTYENWKQDAITLYNEVNHVLKNVTGATIKNHKILDTGIRKVTYDNGVVIYVNTTTSAYETDGIIIPAKGYEMEGVNE